jgi:HlyD family secretion protein
MPEGEMKSLGAKLKLQGLTAWETMSGSLDAFKVTNTERFKIFADPYPCCRQSNESDAVPLLCFVMNPQPSSLPPPLPDSPEILPEEQPEYGWTRLLKLRLPKWLISLLLLGLLTSGGYLIYTRYQAEQRQQQRRQLPTAKVERLTLPVSITANGTVQPEQLVNLSPKNAGILKALLVVEGQAVQAGQIVAQMDDSSLQGQLLQAQGQLASAQANLAKLKAGNRIQDIQQARAQLVAAQSNLEQMRINFEQNQQLYRAGAISKRDFDTSRTAYDMAKAEVARLNQALNLQQVGSRPEDIAQAQAQVQIAEGQLRTIQTQLNDTIIRAPFAGVISRKFADPGSFVTPTTSGSAVTSATSSSILSLASRNEIIAKVAETSIPRVTLGQGVTIQADAYPSQRFPGRVTQVATQSTVEQNVTNFLVHTSVGDPLRRLRAGMNVSVQFNVGTLNNALVIPTVAIVRQEGGTGVYLVGRGRPQFHPITTGATVGDKTEVLTGLKPGQRVLMSFPKSDDRPRGRTPQLIPGLGGGSGGSGGRRGGGF